MKQTDIETVTYEYKNGFMVDIVKTVNDGVGDYWDIWLWHEDYGYKEYLFGIPMNTEPPANISQVLDQITVNLENEDYLQAYRKQFME